MGVGQNGVDEMRQIIGKTGVGKTGIGKMGVDQTVKSMTLDEVTKMKPGRIA